jgi:hypothetical protein
MDDQTSQLFLWLIEENLRLSRHVDNTQQALRLVLSSVGGSVPQATQLEIDFLLAAHRHDDLLDALGRAASTIRQKSEQNESESKS